MDQVTLLRRSLQPHLAWHGARLSFLAMFLIALFRVKTVNLTQLAAGFVGQAQTDSHYKRLQRFFRSFELNYYELAKVIVGLMNIPEPWVLSLDRTAWQFGQTTFNILTLGIVHQGVAFPILWWMQGQKGELQYGRADRVNGRSQCPIPRTKNCLSNCRPRVFRTRLVWVSAQTAHYPISYPHSSKGIACITDGKGSKQV